MGCTSSKAASITNQENASKTLLTADTTTAEGAKEGEQSTLVTSDAESAKASETPVEPPTEALQESQTAVPATSQQGEGAKAQEALAEVAKQPEATLPALSQGDSVLVPLKIKLLGARGLRNADWVGKSDPYCVCEVAGKLATRIETPSVADQLNPEWNHDAEMNGYCVGDSITFLVKDKDPLKPDDALGKVVLEPTQFFPGGFDGEVALTEAGRGIEAFLKMKVEIVHPKVRVLVKGAKGLRNADWVGKSDPYCICQVTGKDDVKFATAPVDDNLDPQWNHEAELLGYQILDALTFTVKDKDPLKPDDILGSVFLPFEAFKGGFDGELPLTQTVEGLSSTLHVKVEVGDEVEQVIAQASQVEEEKKDTVETGSSPFADTPTPQACANEPVITDDTAPSKALCCWC